MNLPVRTWWSSAILQSFRMMPKLCGSSRRSIGNFSSNSFGCSKLRIVFLRSFDSTMKSNKSSMTFCRNSLVWSPDPSFIGKMSRWVEEKEKNYFKEFFFFWFKIKVSNHCLDLNSFQLYISQNKIDRASLNVKKFIFFFECHFERKIDESTLLFKKRC